MRATACHLVWALLILPATQIFAAPAAGTRYVAVQGSCTRSATPDRSEIALTAEYRADEIQSAVKDATSAYERTRDAVKKLGLADLETQTSEYTVSRVVEWEKNRQINRGYQVRMGLRVSTSSIAKMGEVISIAGRQGLKDVGQLRMYLSDAKTLEEKQACLQSAAEHAKSKAERLASSLGAKVGAVLSVQESGMTRTDPVMPMRMAVMAESDAKLSAPQVEAGKQDISVQVDAVFELK